MKKTTNRSYLTFKTMRGAAGAVKRLLKAGASFRDARRRLTARIKMILMTSREVAKAMADKVMVKVICADDFVPPCVDLSPAANKRRRDEMREIFLRPDPLVIAHRLAC